MLAINKLKRSLLVYLTEHPFAVFVSLSALVGVFSFLYAQAFAFTHYIYEKLVGISPFIVFILCPVGLWLAYWLVARYAPLAGGSGIPQVMTTLELNRSEEPLQQARLKEFVRKRVFGIKLLSTLVANVAGAVVGREGPTIQLCSILFYQGKTYLKKIPLFSKVRLSNEVVLATGAAAGLAAAFNTPLGGIMFAIEELAIDRAGDLRVKSILAVIVAGIVAQALGGTYLFLGHPILQRSNFSTLSMVVLFSAIMGALGALAGKMHAYVFSLRKGLSPRIKLYLPIFIGLLWAVVLFYQSFSLAGSGVEEIRATLKGEHIGTLGSSLMRYFSPILFSLSGIAGGIFAPSLSAAAEASSYLASLLGFGEVQAVLVLVAMSAFLTGLIRAPLTSFILVFEMTDVRIATFPMLLSVVTAYGVSSLISHESFYHIVSQAFLKEKPDPVPAHE